MLACDRVVFAHFHLAGRRAGILFGNVEIACIRRRNEADLDDVGLGHRILANLHFCRARRKHGSGIQWVAYMLISARRVKSFR